MHTVFKPIMYLLDVPFEFSSFCLVNNVLLEVNFLSQGLLDLYIQADEMEPYKVQAFSVMKMSK